jgi:hypothetical protein
MTSGEDFEEQHRLDRIKMQYDRLAQDWRQVHTVIWGIPTVAVAIITGILVGAYQPQLIGYPRIVALAMGSVFLFALTGQIVKKRVLMNAIAAKMYFLERDLGLIPFTPGTEDNAKLMKKYNAETSRLGRNGNRDLPYRLFHDTHSRQDLAFVVFLGGLLAAILTYWEFINYYKTAIEFWVGTSLAIILPFILIILRFYLRHKNNTMD